jgi:hypothetical protein
MSPAADAALAPELSPPAEDVVTIRLTGRLDANAGVELLASLQDAVDAGACRVDIELLGIDGWTPEGARALRRCRRLAGVLPGGLHYRTGPGEGHDALLEAFALDDDDEPAGTSATGSDPA